MAAYVSALGMTTSSLVKLENTQEVQTFAESASYSWLSYKDLSKSPCKVFSNLKYGQTSFKL